MEKISPPLRIAIVAVLLFAVAWFLVLRPKPPADEPVTTAPGMTGLANDVKRAEGATAAANAAAGRAQNAAANVDATQGAAATKSTSATATEKKADGATATVTKDSTSSAAAKPGTSGAATKSTSTSATVTGANGTTVTATKKTTNAVAAKPKAKTPAKAKAPADPAAPLVAALSRNKAVVLLFRSRSSDSQAVADAVRAVPKQVGRVVVRVVPISQVGRYSTFTEKTQIAQAPTVLIIGPGRRAKVIVGYTSTAEVAEAVRDLRRAGK